MLAEGRTLDAARMIEPLIRPDGQGEAAGSGDVLLRCLMARIRLLRNGDVKSVLKLLGEFDVPANRLRLDLQVRAEVALWLGWAHVWQDDEFYDDARALNLLDEAARTFHEDLNVSGRCWTLIGQAQAYFTIDEYPLMLEALDEATALQKKVNDVQAATWIAHLSVSGERFRGRYREAENRLDEMRTLAASYDDVAARGWAHAHAAAIAYEMGHSPAEIIDAASQAESILARPAERAGFSLLSAYNAHVGALLRTGEWNEADELVDEALTRTGHLGTACGYLSLHRARICMYRGDLTQAENGLSSVLKSVHRHQRLLTSNAACLFSELTLRRDRPEEAREWAEKALQNAREAGHDGYEVHALLQLAMVSAYLEDVADVRRRLRDMEAHSRYFSLLPFAAQQLALQATFSMLGDRLSEARAFLTQALSACSMIGDTFGVASLQYDLARLMRTSSPSECRGYAEAALRTFEQVGVKKEARRLRDLLLALPGSTGNAHQLSEADIAAALSRSALSVDLVAETWLRIAGEIAPNRWIGVYKYDENTGWSPVRTHGQHADIVTYPDSTVDRLCEDGVDWIRLKYIPSMAFFFAMECGGEDDPACRVIEDRLSAWIPVVGLAFEHALLRGSTSQNSSESQSRSSERKGSLEGFVYASDAMRRIVSRVERLRSSHSPVLITGECGTGKGVIAAVVHRTSDRRDAPWVAFNCANVSRERFDEQLFGRAVNWSDSRPAPGGGASSDSSGLGAALAAHGGTLFLDRIEELPMEIQPRVLALLENGQIQPVGATEPVNVNVRIIAATTEDLRELVRGEAFREDLFYRLNVVRLRVPSLRERREEIPLLVHHFLRTLTHANGQRASLTNRALEAMMGYHWPGNVRQLRNEIERVLVFTESEPAPMLDLDDLSDPIVESFDSTPSPPPVGVQELLTEPDGDGGCLDEILASAEKAVIERALAGNDGQVTSTAEALGLTRQGLYKKMKRLGIDSSRFHASGNGKPGEAATGKTPYTTSVL